VAPCMLELVLYVSLSWVTQLPSLCVSRPGPSLNPLDPVKGLSLSEQPSPLLFCFFFPTLGDLLKGGDKRGFV